MRPAKASRRRRYSFAAGIAVLLALGVFIGGAVEASAQPAVAEMAEAKAGGPAKRFPVNDPTTVKPGYFFTLLDKADNPNKQQMERRIHILRQIIQQENPIDYLMEFARQVGADPNARAMIGSLDGVLTTIIIIQTHVALHKDDKTKLEEALRTATNTIHGSNGAKLSIPVLAAAHVHMAELGVASAALGDQHAWRPLEITYEAGVTGTCPFDAGPITITQREFAVEGTRDGRLLLVGALGKSTAYFIANEQRYGSISKTSTGRPLLDAPDRTSELYEAKLGSERLTLSGTIFKECEIVLAP